MWICFFPRCTELASVWSPCVQRSSQSTSYLLLSPMIKVLARPGTRAIQHEKRSTHEDLCSIFVVVRELNGFRKNINTPSTPVLHPHQQLIRQQSNQSIHSYKYPRPNLFFSQTFHHQNAILHHRPQRRRPLRLHGPRCPCPCSRRARSPQLLPDWRHLWRR